MQQVKKSTEVFGVSNTILLDSYIDRGDLDSELQKLLTRSTHVALRGESKCGKSWLRQRNIPDAITVQCRFEKTVSDIYVDALAQLGISLTIQDSSGNRIKGQASASGEIGFKLIAKATAGGNIEAEATSQHINKPIGKDINDLRHIADIITASGKRLIIEDFHYLSVEERKRFAFDLKALWDYGVFVVVIGVWTQSNMLLDLNPDLTARIVEQEIYWSNDDLIAVIDKGSKALNVSFGDDIKKHIVSICFGNVGILQTLILRTLDEAKIDETCKSTYHIGNLDLLETAALSYADQLNPLYQQFARRVSSGIRTRRDSTGIYAHAMAVILEAEDADLLQGISVDYLFQIANGREPRIQKGNLKKVLEKFEELQVDEQGRGLVITYNEATEEISVVDRQLLLYRRYCTVKWPWEDLIAEAKVLADEAELNR